MITVETILQAVVALVFLVSGAVLAVRNAVKFLPTFGRGSTVPKDDVRIVSDLCARLRSQGKTPAVQIGLQLLAELLKPEEPKP